MTLIPKRLAKWRSCDKCELHKERQKVVLYRGDFPCDILFIGEAPGRQEDKHGKPFIGPSGKILESLISEAYSGEELSHGITNIVGCVPWSHADKNPVRPPTAEEAAACYPRLDLTIKLASPKGVVLLGKSAASYTKKIPFPTGLPVLKLVHPAYILRQGGYGPSPARSQFVVYLRDFLKELEL